MRSRTHLSSVAILGAQMGCCTDRGRDHSPQCFVTMGEVRAMHGTVVCGVTDKIEGDSAVQLAAALAVRLGMRLVLVHVVADEGQPVSAGSGRTPEAAEIRIVSGSRVDGLTRAAAEEGADVIVLGSRPRGARGRQLRCTLARELEAATSVPVLIAPPATRARSGRRLALAEPVARR